MSRSLNNTEVPELRFSGFDEDWNELKFNKLIQLISGQHLSPHEYSLDSGEIPYFTGPSDFTNDVSKITKWTKYSEKSAQKSDILITVKGNGVGEMLFLHLPCVAMGRQLMAIRPIAVVGQILYQKLFAYKQQFQALASGNVIPGLSRPDILTTKIYLPGLKEQEKITSFLGAVDTRLTQLRRKHELLQTYKRGVMQKLFSQQIRFKRDRGKPFRDWEEKKLGSFIEEYSKKSKIQDEYEVLTSSRNGLLPQRQYYDNERITERDNIGFNIIPPNFVTYRSRSDDRLFFINENKLNFTGIISTYYPVFRFKNGVNKFFIEFLRYNQNYIGKYSVGTSQTVLSLNELRKINFKIPCLKEQAKIADFLTTIDKKIEAVAKQIELTEQFKKGLLQKMFV